MNADATTQTGDLPEVNLDRERVKWRLQSGEPGFTAAWMKLAKAVDELRQAGTLILN